MRLVVGVLAMAVVIQAVVIAVVMLSFLMRRRGQTSAPAAWTTFAARSEACSGHGTEYSYDSVVWCECLNCWSGSQCQLHDDAVRQAEPVVESSATLLCWCPLDSLGCRTCTRWGRRATRKPAQETRCCSRSIGLPGWEWQTCCWRARTK